MSVRTFREEGSASSKLAALIRQIGHNTDVQVRLGTVTSPPPNLKIKIDGRAGELESDDCIVAESLVDHKRSVSISGGSVSGSVSTGGNLTTLTVTDAEMSVKGVLTQGTRVIALAYETQYGTQYVILDKAVSY